MLLDPAKLTEIKQHHKNMLGHLAYLSYVPDWMPTIFDYMGLLIEHIEALEQLPRVDEAPAPFDRSLALAIITDMRNKIDELHHDLQS